MAGLGELEEYWLTRLDLVCTDKIRESTGSLEICAVHLPQDALILLSSSYPAPYNNDSIPRTFNPTE